MDSIAAVLLSEYFNQDYLVIPILRQIYTRYIRYFLDEHQNLRFEYSSLVLKRLLNFYEPELQAHFYSIDFTQNLYPLVSWVMTLFAHTV
jgi:Rab-GTPase-TBC domain